MVKPPRPKPPDMCDGLREHVGRISRAVCSDAWNMGGGGGDGVGSVLEGERLEALAVVGLGIAVGGEDGFDAVGHGLGEQVALGDVAVSVEVAAASEVGVDFLA